MLTEDATLTPSIEARSAQALTNDHLRGAVRFTVERLRTAKAGSTEAFGDWQQWRELGRSIRAHTIQHLDYYLAEFSENARAQGTEVHFASDAEEAQNILLGIIESSSARRVVKSKSMVSEELHVNQVLSRAGVEVVETDLGEWIVQLAQETPSQLILPAIHKRREEIQDLFEAEGGQTLSKETAVLAGYARDRLREKFAAADLGITGCNFAVAETGSVALFTNEGNGRMVTTLPRTHVVLMGMERILPTLADLSVMAQLLPRSATGQKITTYLNLVTGTRREDEADGPRRVHVIVVDNGRSRQLGDPKFQEVLNCIRCGACLNVCPVYRHIGGHAYGSVYSGPIGAVLTPLLAGSPASELAQASTLCGACHEACPVKIPLHDMLVELRRKNVESGLTKPTEGAAFSLYGFLYAHPRLLAWLSRTGRRVLSLLGPGPRRWLSKRLGGWTRTRSLPVLAGESFTRSWRGKERRWEL
jgi:L-lactate dehydrogenase complex protein LldF